MVFRGGIDNPNFEFAAINDLTDAATLAHLLKYDSVHGKFDGHVEVDGDSIVVNGKRIRVFAERDPKNLPWESLESSMLWRRPVFSGTGIKPSGILMPAPRVIITAPAKNEDITIVMGVNEDKYDRDHHHLDFQRFLHTNCLAPVAQVLHEEFVIKRLDDHSPFVYQ